MHAHHRLDLKEIVFSVALIGAAATVVAASLSTLMI
jgi:hypothetical protein